MLRVNRCCLVEGKSNLHSVMGYRNLSRVGLSMAGRRKGEAFLVVVFVLGDDDSGEQVRKDDEEELVMKDLDVIAASNVARQMVIIVPVIT